MVVCAADRVTLVLVSIILSVLALILKPGAAWLQVT